VKPVKAKPGNFRRFDNPMMAVLTLWAASRKDDWPAMSREESVLASLVAAQVYVESAMRASGTGRERVTEVIRRGTEVGEHISEACASADELNIPPTVGVAGDMLGEIMKSGIDHV
jgi:hypothetical protein